MSIGIRADSILLNRVEDSRSTRRRAWLTVLIAAGLGWMLAGPAIRPLRRLTEHTKQLGKGSEQMPEVRGVREAEDLSEAMSGMLSRLAAAQRATTNSLQAAQDFAANAAHELRTPLTAMRADLDTLRIHDLPAEERAEVVADLSRAQRRVEAIITALGQLASGQLAQAEDRELIDVTDMLDRVARENMRVRGTSRSWWRPTTTSAPSGAGRAACGWPSTTWCATRSRTGRRRRIVLDGAARAGDDDRHRRRRQRARTARRGARDGPRPVLPRQHRGPGGSGLGLALVAQQAALHGGSIELSDGPLGGLRATLTVSTSSSAKSGLSAAARSSATARQPSSSTAVASDATTMKLGATPCRVSFAQHHPDHDCAHPHGHAGGHEREPDAASPRDSSQPTAVPTRNGHAVSAMPATVSPSAWLRRPIAQNTTTQRTSAGNAVNAGTGSLCYRSA